jgi:CheY-like chemotaxis protein
MEGADSMAIVAIDAGVFCHGPEVAADVRERLCAAELSDEELFAAASKHSGIAVGRFEKLVYGPHSLLAGIRRDRALLVAHLRAAVAATMGGAKTRVYLGRAGHLVPPALTHVLKVCLGGTHDSRLRQAEAEGVSKRDAQRQISKDDELRAEWTLGLLDRGPWEKDLYDVFIAMQESSVDGAVEMITTHALQPAVAVTPSVEQAVRDFRLSAEVGVALAKAGHDADVLCSDGAITVLIKQHSMFLERLERELVEIAAGVPDVRSASARPGPHYREPGISFDIDIEVPSKVMLVDDEEEFVLALSERLQTRRMTPVVAFNGEQALAMVENDEPEVMVLDLKMPGIDGMEVLRRVKRTHPSTEVIILTGHGTDAEEVLARELGAYAYLRKPVDIEELTETMKAAYRRLEETRAEGGGD